MDKFVTPKFRENTTNNIYKYQYFFDFDDKVYYTKSNSDLTKQIFKKWNIVRKNRHPKPAELKNLAGDLSEEYFYNSATNINIDYIESFLTKQLENICDKKIDNLSFESKNHDGQTTKDLWVNYQHQYEHNPLHKHSGIFSFVWYLDIPEEIRQEHHNQTSNSETRGMLSFQSSRSSENLIFNPKTTDVLIFKSDHRHQVYPFYTHNTRVSMAGNIHTITFEDGETITA